MPLQHHYPTWMYHHALLHVGEIFVLLLILLKVNQDPVLTLRMAHYIAAMLGLLLIGCLGMAYRVGRSHLIMAILWTTVSMQIIPFALMCTPLTTGQAIIIAGIYGGFVALISPIGLAIPLVLAALQFNVLYAYLNGISMAYSFALDVDMHLILSSHFCLILLGVAWRGIFEWAFFLRKVRRRVREEILNAPYSPEYVDHQDASMV